MQGIGHYETLGLIGDGGMGAVYRARDPRFDRLVAIKVLHPQFQRDPGVVERFKSEAVIQAKLNHPNIVTVLDFVADESTLAMVMEYVEGVPLSQVIEAAGGPLSADRVIRIMDQVLSAMAFAHARQLVHRDLKPSNILVQTVENDEFAKVMDFGIAKILGSEKLQTATGAKMGTLAYMSPEHVRSPKNVDARSDIYSLGVVLYQMLTGRVPFDADSEYELMRQIVEAPIQPLDHLPPTAAALSPIVERALAKDPGARYATCTEMRDAIAAVSQGRAVSSGVRREVAAAGSAVSAPAVWSVSLPAASRTTAPASEPTPRPAVPTTKPQRTGRWVGVAAASVAGIVLVGGGLMVVAARQDAEKGQVLAQADLAAQQNQLRAAAEEQQRLMAETERLRAQTADAQRAAEAARLAEMERQAQQLATDQEAQRQKEVVEAARLEAERAEAARLEAARIEAARLEAARIEAERAAAAERVRIANLSVSPGTSLVLRLQQGVSSSSARQGMQVEATLVRALESEGHTIIPAGSRVVGEVADLASGASGEVPMFELAFNRIFVEGAGSVSISTSVYTAAGKKRVESDRVANALAGALLGGLLGGKKGAAGGAAMGASADSGESAQAAMIMANQQLEVQLRTSVRRP